MYAEAVRYRTDLACILFDLDGFKEINDTLGHHAGDELLIEIAKIIKRETRASDLAARFGGDEFVILMPHTGCDTAVTLAQRIVETFSRICSFDARSPDTLRACGMSVGVASISTSSPHSGEDLIHHADKAMYAAKDAGRRCIRVCGPDGRIAVPPDNLAA